MKQTLEAYVVVTVTVPEQVRDQIIKFAEAKEWSIAQTGRHLIRLGLEQLNKNQKTAKSRTKKRSTPALA